MLFLLQILEFKQRPYFERKSSLSIRLCETQKELVSVKNSLIFTLCTQEENDFLQHCRMEMLWRPLLSYLLANNLVDLQAAA